MHDKYHAYIFLTLLRFYLLEVPMVCFKNKSKVRKLYHYLNTHTKYVSTEN